MDKTERRDRRIHRKSNGNVIAGILLLLVGGALLLRQLDFALPRWLFYWPMIVIVAGVFIGAVNRFRDFSWLIICGVGFFFLVDDIWPNVEASDYIWPAVIIIIGLALLFRPRMGSGGIKPFIKVNPKTWGATDDEEPYVTPGKPNKEDVLDVAAVFGSVKKNLYSKTFRGGEIVSVFGGVEIDLSQSDFEHIIKIESVQIFGGATLIVPPTWQIRSEAVAIFGGIEDKRRQIVQQDPERILILEGFVMFGGIEIKSY